MFLTLALLPAASSTWAQDDYLKALEAEATKIQAPAVESDGQTPSSPSVPTAPEENRIENDVSREQFDDLLLEQYRGTYAFFKELPPAVQTEIYSRYQKGTPMAELRGMIVDRYLQR